MRFLRISNGPWRMESYHHRDNGDVLAATCRSRSYRAIILVGVRRRQIPNRSLDYHLILVVRHVLRLGQDNAHILVSLSAMLVLARPVLTWDRLCHVSVAKRRPPDDAWIRITIADGAVGRFAEMFFRVESIFANEDVTRAYVGAVRF